MKAPERVLRKNREVTDEARIRCFLTRAATCVVATVGDGRPFVNPNLFYFDAGRDVFYFHTAGRGRTRSNIEANPSVSVSVSEMGRLLPGPKVTDYSVEYASVVIHGRASVVTDAAEARSVLDRQLAKYFPDKQPYRDFAPFTDEEMFRATVFRVEIEQWTAKTHREAPDFAGATSYPAFAWSLPDRDAGSSTEEEKP